MRTVVIDGEISLLSYIDGEINLSNIIDGEGIQVIEARNYDYYEGEYTFTPTSSAQTIPCANLMMSQNMTINPIPSNYGLITYNGSTITVS